MSERRQPYPSEAADKVLLRLPDGMRDRLKAAAEANNRSLNAEIVNRLEASLTSAQIGLSDKEQSDAIALFASGLMQAMHYGKEIGRMVKVEVSVSDDVKAEAEKGEKR